MEKPDADGFVNITWPSKSVPHGGLFHVRRAEINERQQNLLKVLKEESQLTLAQRKKSAFKLREETPARPSRPTDEQLLQMVVKIRPRTSKRRSLSAIRASGIYETDDYRPIKMGVDREKLKERLANTMAYGDNEDNIPKPPPRAPVVTKLPTKKEMWNDLLTQIRERAEWIEEMEDLGHAGPHREFIQEEIQERLRLMEALDVDSECSSSRSGFSTLRSREGSIKSQGSKKSNKIQASPQKVESAKSDHSRLSRDTQQKRKIAPIARATKDKEENVASYEKLGPLQHSPRRRQ